jgi:hypothetical protein
VARFVAQGGDQAVCEVSSDRPLETLERRFLSSVIGDEG